jgi:hypothetical protein
VTASAVLGTYRWIDGASGYINAAVSLSNLLFQADCWSVPGGHLMLRLYNPLEKSITQTQIYSFILYGVFLSASVWAAAESLARTAHLPRLFCYIAAFGLLSGASFCLALVKRSLSPGYVKARTGLLAVGSVGFVLLWLVTLTSNTHNFYFVSAVGDLRRAELGEASEKLRLLPERSKLAGKAAKDALIAEVEAKIETMKSEIMNPEDPGSGIKTERVIIEIERLLQSSIQRLNYPSNKHLYGLTRYANGMANQIRVILGVRLAEMDRASANVDNYLAKPEFTQMTGRLKAALAQGMGSLQEDALKDLLRSAFEMYNEGTEFIRQAYALPRLEKYLQNFEPLPKAPRSIRLENIAEAWKDFMAGQFEPWKFWLSFLWAFSLDVATFVLFYFGVIPRDDY